MLPATPTPSRTGAMAMWMWMQQVDIVMRPRGAHGPALSLPAIVDRARAEGLRLPLLVRFPGHPG